MALTFIGKPISLISHSDVRYRGILAGIDPAASTIQLSNVYSMGTESRRPPDAYIPPVSEPYQYIIFRASEVKDLSVDDPSQGPTRRTAHDDPAVIAASQPMPFNPYNAQGPFPPGVAQGGGQGAPQQAQASYPARQSNGPNAQGQSSRNASSPAGAQNGRRNAPSINSATASMETVERALGDLRVNNGAGGQRGGRRGGGRDIKAGDMRVPVTDFDFQGSNARFDKTAVAPSTKPTRINQAEEEEKSVGSEDDEENEEKEKDDGAYNPKKSFFDQLSSSAAHPPPHGMGGGRGRGRGGRSRREEEREKNVATFGEPGGIGLMGPNAYVGGYGRRGGRPRRGGPPQTVTR